MATSKPEFQGIIGKDSGTNYCGLYKRRVINTSSVAATQYYWLPTNQSGDITDFRANSMNGTFSSDTLALASYPSGYSGYADNWAKTKYLSYMSMYPFSDIGQFYVNVDWFVQNGANNILIPVLWSDVFDSYNSGSGRRQDQNYNSSYEYKMNLAFDYVKDNYPAVKISVMPLLYMDWGRVVNFWGQANAEKDNWGNPLRLGYDNGHPPLGDKSTGTGRYMAKDFFTKLITYYANRLGSQFNYVMPVITEQAEFGHNYENGLSPYKAIIGYSDATKAAFRVWLFDVVNPNKYANLAALNSAWGTGYSTTGDIEPPNTGLSQGGTDETFVQGLNTVFASKRGVDWYLFREYMLYDFANDLKSSLSAINSTYSTSIKFILAFGGVAPNDSLVPLRGSYDVIKWGEISDGLKAAFASDNRENNTSLTLDYLQNYPGKIMTELHDIDYSQGGLSPNVVLENMTQSGRDAIINNTKDLLFIGGSYKGSDWLNMLKSLFLTLKPEFLKDNDGSRVKVVNGAAAINLGELLYNGNRVAGIQKWNNGGGRRDNRINITFTNTVAPAGDANYPITFQVKDNQRYYIRQEDIKNSYYGFRSLEDELSNASYTTRQQDYNTNRVPILVPAFGITYSAGDKTKCIIEISDTTGTKWVKMEQLFGVNTSMNGVDYSNNHPEYRYLNNPNLAEDCRFWLPIPASGVNYEVKITVSDASCKFEVYHADTGAPSGVSYNATVSAGANNTYTLLRANIQQSNVNQRLVKINCNKYA